MKLSERSFPHPVVGNRDDVSNAGFQSTLSLQTDKQTVFLDAQIACSSTTINKAVEEGKATFAVHVECSNTLYRRSFSFSENPARFSIDANLLNNEVEVNAFAIATTDISNYKVDGAHPDYGDASFSVRKGDLLAVGQGQTFSISNDYDSIDRVGSIMEIVASEKEDVPMEVRMEEPKILIVLSKKDFENYWHLRHSSLAPTLTTTIVLPVLMEALYELRRDPEAENPRWKRILGEKLKAMNLNVEDDSLYLSQMILELPIRRALQSAREIEDQP